MLEKQAFNFRKTKEKFGLGALFNKYKLQHLLFPDGFAYDKQNKRVLTFRTNVFFELIRSISTVLSEIKNGESVNIDQISARVTSKV